MGRVQIGNTSPDPEPTDMEQTGNIFNEADETDWSIALEAHVESPTPHPVYDDMQSLEGLFENGIV